MSEPRAWRLLLDGAAGGAWNMAVDEALLDAVAAGDAPPTLRFFQWQPACLSLGYFQPYGVVDAEACAVAGVEVVRRPTGGRAILHDRELTYSVALPLSLLAAAQGVLPSYFRLSQALLAGLREAGAWVTLAVADRHGTGADHGPACFDRPSEYEVLLDGRKVVGSAQVRRGGALLQHGSILFEPQVEPLLRCLRLDPEVTERWRISMEKGVGGLKGHVGEPVTVAAAIAGGFERVFDTEVRAGQLTDPERHAAQLLASAKYGAIQWTRRS